MVALTGKEARDAVTHAKELSEKIRELDTLKGSELEAQTTAFKVVKFFSDPMAYSSAFALSGTSQKRLAKFSTDWGLHSNIHLLGTCTLEVHHSASQIRQSNCPQECISEVDIPVMMPDIYLQAVDTAIISAPDKAMLREGITRLQKKIQESNKMAGAENKRKAVEAALEAAKAAASGERGFLITQLDVGLDTKAVQEAYKAVQEAHPTMPCLFVTADSAGKKGDTS